MRNYIVTTWYKNGSSVETVVAASSDVEASRLVHADLKSTRGVLCVVAENAETGLRD